jgi:hypothetical protein
MGRADEAIDGNGRNAMMVAKKDETNDAERACY